MRRPTKDQMEFGFIAVVLSVLFVLGIVRDGLIHTLAYWGVLMIVLAAVMWVLALVRKVGR